MKMYCSGLVRQEKGKVLIMVLILLVVGGLVLTPLLGLMSTGLIAGQVYEGKMLQLYAADAGVEEAIHWLLEGKPDEHPWVSAEESDPWDWERGADLGINRNEVAVTIEALSADDTYKIISTATDDHRQTTVTSVVMAAARFKGCYITEDTTFNNQSGTLEGTIIVVGDVEIEHNHDLDAYDMLIDGDLHMANNSELHAEVICVTGDITLAERAKIYAHIHFLGEDCTLTIDQPQSYVRGNIWAEGNLTIRILLGSALVEVYCPDGVYAHGDVHVQLAASNSELAGHIYAGGEITIDKGHPPPSYEYCRYYFDEDKDLWVSDDGCAAVEDPPFTIADCPPMPSTQVIVHVYEVT